MDFKENVGIVDFQEFEKTVINCIRLLIIDESSEQANIVKEALDQSRLEDFVMEQVQSYSVALSLLEKKKYDVVMINQEVTNTKIVKALADFRKYFDESAFIILMPEMNEPLARSLLSIGVQDYFLKSEISTQSLGRAIRYSISRIKSQRLEKSRTNKLKSLYSEKLETELKLKRKSEALEKRVKELDCLFSVSFLMENETMPIDETLQKITGLVPLAWLYPETACARIRLHEREYKTPNYLPTEWFQKSPIYQQQDTIGSLEVGYLEKKPDLFEGPFLREERDLIDALSLRIGRFIERKKMEEESKKIHKRLASEVRQQKSSLTDISTQLQKEKNERQEVAIKLDKSQKVADKHALKMEKVLNLQIKILENVVFGVVFLKNRIIEWFNDRTKTMLNYCESDLENAGLHMLFPNREEYDRYTKAADPELKKNGFYAGEWRLKLASGNHAWFSIQEKTIEIVGESHESIWIITNINQQKIEEQKRKKIEFMVNTSKNPMCMIDREFHLISFNNSFARAQNRFPEELHRLHVSNLFQKDVFEEKVKPVLDKCFSGDTVLSDEIHMHKGTEERHFQTVFYPYREKGTVTNIVAISNDVTEMKRTEDALILARDKAEEMNRLKSDFLNIVSHELRTPLTVILANTPFLTNKEQMLSPDDVIDVSTDIEESARQLLTLVNDLLDFSKIEAGKMTLSFEQMGVDTITEEVLKNVHKLLEGKKLAMIRNIEKFTIEADPFRLKQILFNILSNAVKFTERGSITVNVRKEDQMAVFEIIDTGCGIKEENQEVIFDVFRQLDDSLIRSVGGTGLGLAITKKLVAQHNGSIKVVSVYGEGSRFTVKIPIQHAVN
ncbi:PAS domain-containing sensor histidine kinase [bacterium]|nr:PAS domain-containing sensor histidine kinase [bacterium]